MTRDIDDVLYKRGIIVKPVDKPWKEMSDDRWLTREEAIAWLKIWKDQNVPKYNLVYSTMYKNHFTSGVQNAYLTGMISEMIEMIRESDEDPVTTVAEYYYQMDEILATSDDDHFITHRFASFMERESYDVLLFLKEKEKELNRNEH